MKATILEDGQTLGFTWELDEHSGGAWQDLSDTFNNRKHVLENLGWSIIGESGTCGTLGYKSIVFFNPNTYEAKCLTKLIEE